jgi:hypothetical protein
LFTNVKPTNRFHMDCAVKKIRENFSQQPQTEMAGCSQL